MTGRTKLMTLALLGAFTLSGCAFFSDDEYDNMQAPDDRGMEMTQDRTYSNFSDEELRRQLLMREQQIASLEASLRDAAEECDARVEYQARLAREAEGRLQAAMDNPTSAGPFPNARPGECYAPVFIPPVTTTVTDRVLVKEASERIEVIPARYETVNERVLVQEASERILEVRPAEYRTVTERVEVKPASTRLERIPAQYRTVTEQVLERPAYTMWKRGTGPIYNDLGQDTRVIRNGQAVTRRDQITGDILCLVEVPAKYKTVAKQVLVTPETTREVPVAAEYRNISKRVQVRPPDVRKVSEPAQYRNVPTRRLVQPAQERRIPVPAEYRTVTREEVVTEGRTEWRQVICETNRNYGSTVSRMQGALRYNGYDPGHIDGRMGPKTEAALRAYQVAHNLPVGGMNYDTLTALGVQQGSGSSRAYRRK